MATLPAVLNTMLTEIIAAPRLVPKPTFSARPGKCWGIAVVAAIRAE